MHQIRVTQTDTEEPPQGTESAPQIRIHRVKLGFPKQNNRLYRRPERMRMASCQLGPGVGLISQLLSGRLARYWGYDQHNHGRPLNVTAVYAHFPGCGLSLCMHTRVHTHTYTHTEALMAFINKHTKLTNNRVYQTENVSQTF